MFLLFLDCNCNLTGSLDKTCDGNGTCTCKNRLIGGSKCDQCIPTYFSFPNCQGNHFWCLELHTFQIFDDFVACGCNVRGVEKGDLTCNSSGSCNCRCDVVGDKCNMCQVGHQGFPDCDGMSTKEVYASFLKPCYFQNHLRWKLLHVVVLPLDHQVQLVMFLENVRVKLATLEKNVINVKVDTIRIVLEHA